MPSRRTFLATAAATTLSPWAGFAQDDSQAAKNPVCVFTKPFNSLTFEELAARTAELGFDGVEATIREGGHIEPVAVPDALPRLVEALQKHGLELTVMTSDINDPRDPLTATVLTAAAKLGIRFYRMKYFKYDESRPILGQIDEWRARLKDLAAMNRELGVTAVYQNHAGRGYFGAPVWDLQRALEGIEPTEVGVAYDIRHATVEAGMSWPIGFHLIRPHIQVVYVKDFVWSESNAENVPLGQGRVDPKFFSMLSKSGFSGPISLHEEYLDHRKPELVPQHWDALSADFGTLKQWL